MSLAQLKVGRPDANGEAGKRIAVRDDALGHIGRIDRSYRKAVRPGQALKFRAGGDG